MNYDPYWTFEEALEAEWGATGDRNDPTRPLARWMAYARLNALELDFANGRKTALMLAIRICIKHTLPLPAWAGKAFIEGHNKVLFAEAKSWDEVFGAPYAKGVNLRARRRRMELQKAIRREVEKILKEEPGTPIDVGLFERVGEIFGIGKTSAAEAYYDNRVYVWKDDI